MRVELADLLNLRKLPRSPLAARREFVQRAYGDTIETLSMKLGAEFSMLVYLPGNCMEAMAECVMARVGGGSARWKQYGRRPDKGGSILDIWKGAGELLGGLRAMINSEEPSESHAVFYNLDLLRDGSGHGVHNFAEALTTQFALMEAARWGTVLGLADRESGDLPRGVEAQFDEVIKLGEIPKERFAKLIPREIGAHWEADCLTSLASQLAARMRWMDPVRVVKILANCTSVGNDLDALLETVGKVSKEGQFVQPPKDIPGVEKGFPDAVLQQVRHLVIAPFRRWKGSLDNPVEAEAALRKLPIGTIFYGPPGTGKTLLARWISKELQLPLRIVRAADIKDPEFGRAEQNIHRLFAEAKRSVPCILMLDEADDLLPSRDERSQSSVGGAEIGIVTAILKELDGVFGRIPGLLVLMTTNRMQSLDRAVKDRQRAIRVPYPLDAEQVGAIVEHTAAEFRLDLTAVKDRLVEMFMRARLPLRPDQQGLNLYDPEVRAKFEESLFSARNIREAMLRLEPADNTQTPYAPNEDDLLQLEKHLDRVRNSPTGME